MVLFCRAFLPGTAGWGSKLCLRIVALLRLFLFHLFRPRLFLLVSSRHDPLCDSTPPLHPSWLAFLSPLLRPMGSSTRSPPVCSSTTSLSRAMAAPSCLLTPRKSGFYPNCLSRRSLSNERPAPRRRLPQSTPPAPTMSTEQSRLLTLP